MRGEDGYFFILDFSYGLNEYGFAGVKTIPVNCVRPGLLKGIANKAFRVIIRPGNRAFPAAIISDISVSTIILKQSIMTTQEIAARLVVEVGTVKNHVHSILEKLNVSNREEAASYLAYIKK